MLKNRVFENGKSILFFRFVWLEKFELPNFAEFRFSNVSVVLVIVLVTDI